MDLPPPAVETIPLPAFVAPAPLTPECRYLSNTEAQAAFRRLKQALPSTSFEGAEPSEVCGLVKVKLSRGNTVYTDASGRFFILGTVLDTHRGGPADRDDEIERTMEYRETVPTLPDGITPIPLEK